MRYFASILALLSMLSVSAGFSVCWTGDMQNDCCCTPQVVEKQVTPEHRCCSEPEPVAPEPVSSCSCSIKPVDEELPTSFRLPSPDCSERLSALTYDLLPLSAIHAPEPATAISGLRHLCAPPGPQVPLYELHTSLRL